MCLFTLHTFDYHITLRQQQHQKHEIVFVNLLNFAHFLVATFFNTLTTFAKSVQIGGESFSFLRVCVVQLNGILLLLCSFTRSIPFSLHIYGLLLLLFVSSFGVFLSPCEYALLQCVRVCLSLEFFTFGIHLMAHDKKHYTIHIYTEMSIDSLTLSSTLCTAAMHIGSHSIHYTAMKQASKQTNTEHNKTRLHSVRCGFVVWCFTRECSINARSVCCILCYMLLSFFPPFSLLHHTQHSIDAPQRPLVFAVVCVLQFVFI